MSSIQKLNFPLQRDVYKKAGSAALSLLIIAYGMLISVSALLTGINTGIMTQALGPSILILILLYVYVPTTATSIATILLVPSFLKGDHSKVARKLSLLYRVLDRLPVYRSGYRTMLSGEIARAQTLLGDFAGAEETYLNVLCQFSQAIPKIGTGANSLRAAHNFLVPALFNVYAGAVCTKQNKVSEAERHFEKARDIFSAYPVVGTTYGGILDLQDLGLALILKNQPRAEISLNSAVAFLKQDNILNGFTKLDRARVTSFMHVLAAVYYLRKGEITQADAETVNYIAFQKMHAGNSMAIGWLNVLAHEYLIISEYQKAELVLETAYWIGMQTPMHPDCEDTLSCFGQLLASTGRSSEIADLKRWIRPMRHNFLIEETILISKLEGDNDAELPKM